MSVTPLPRLEMNRKPSCWIGIDPGATGAIAALLEGSPLPALFPMPTRQITTGTGKTKKNKTIMDEAKLRSIFGELQKQSGEIFALIETATLRSAIYPSGHNCPACHKPHMIAGQGITSQAEFYGGYQLIRGILIGLGIGHESILPRVWKSQVFEVEYASSDVSEKELSRRKARSLYPIIAAKFDLVKSHGLAEALLLADFNRRRNEAPF